MPFLVYQGTSNAGTLLTASEISPILVLDGKDVLTFQLDDSTTTITQKEDIYCEYSYDETNYGIFEGFVETISTNHPRLVTCLGVVAKMEWYMVEENQTTTILDEGIVKQVNAGDGTRLDLYDNDSVAITDTAPYANPNPSYPEHYLIVSDATKEETVLNLQNGANNWIGYSDELSPAAWGTETNDYTKVDNASFAADEDHWKVIAIKGALDWYTNYFMTINLGLENYGIAITETLTNLHVEGTVYVKVGFELMAFENIQSHFLIGLTLYGNGNTTVIWSYGNRTAIIDRPVLLPFAFDIKNPNCFTEGEPNYTGGAFRLSIYWSRGINANTENVPYTEIQWQALKASISHTTKTFDTLNDAITFTEAGDTIGTAHDYGATGVTANDRWMVGIDYNLALARCFLAEAETSLPANLRYVINQSTSLGKGIAKRFNGATGFEMMEGLVKDIDFHYWANYNPATINIDSIAHMLAAVTLNTPAVGSVAQLEQYSPATICVVWKDGYVYAATGVSGAKGLIKFQEENILTKAEAKARATIYATKYAQPTYAIELKYSGSCLVANGAPPQLGALYDVTLYNDDGTTTTYEDLPARRITMFNSGSDEYYEISMSLGLGSTPTEEKIPKDIETIKKQLMQEKIVRMTSTYTPTNRHNALLGIAGNADAYHMDSTFGTVTAFEDAASNNADRICSSQSVYEVKTTADAALPKAGGTMTDLIAITSKGLVELRPIEERCTNNISINGFALLNDNDTDVAYFQCMIPPDYKSGTTATLYMIVYNTKDIGTTIKLTAVSFYRFVKDSTLIIINNWNQEAGDTFTFTATLDGAPNNKFEHQLVLDNITLAAYDKLRFTMQRNGGGDSWGEACGIAFYITYTRAI
jgi:hypothetical protein